MLILMPAAGASSRMRGRDKLLEPVDGQPLLTERVDMALQSGAQVLVTLPPDNPARVGVMDGIDSDRLDVRVIKDAAEGMAASIRRGAITAKDQGQDGLMICLPDMPDIETADLIRLMDLFNGTEILRACDEEGQSGHPVLFPTPYFPVLAELTGDQGARDLLRREHVQCIPLPGHRATTDLDTPEDWSAWRTRTGR